MKQGQSITNILNNTDGFTLVEALVALGVLTIGILTMYTMQTASVRGNYKASRITSAAAVAADRMEELNALPYDDAQLEDQNNDSTGQDANSNGIDDDDEGGGVPAVDGIANFGLDQAVQATADYTITDALTGYTMYYNVAVGQPVENMKTIRVILVREADQQPMVFDYYKAASL